MTEREAHSDCGIDPVRWETPELLSARDCFDGRANDNSTAVSSGGGVGISEEAMEKRGEQGECAYMSKITARIAIEVLE